jgi:hypothetical protein
MSAADLIVAAVASASDDGRFEYVAPSNTVAVVAMGTKASESTKNETAAAAVGGAAPESPRGSSSSATNTSAPVPSGKTPVVVAGNICRLAKFRGAAGTRRFFICNYRLGCESCVTPSSGSPSTPISVRAAFTTPPSGAPRPPADVLLSNREKLAAAVGTSDFEMVDPVTLAVVVDSLVEATRTEANKIARLGPQYDGVLCRLENCDASEYDRWEARTRCADKVLAQQTLEKQGWLSYL